MKLREQEKDQINLLRQKLCCVVKSVRLISNNFDNMVQEFNYKIFC